MMNGMGEQLFADPRFAGDEHGRVGWCDAASHLHRLQNGRAVSFDAVERVRGRGQLADFFFQSVELGSGGKQFIPQADQFGHILFARNGSDHGAVSENRGCVHQDVHAGAWFMVGLLNWLPFFQHA
jgi:hypothetical protein